jgi:DNA-binding NtrC family response regulator
MHRFKPVFSEQSTRERSHFPVLAGNSIVALAIRQMVHLAASVSDPLVISGPEASGKAAIAHAVHMLSALSDDMFLTFDCADVSDVDRDCIFAIGLHWPGKAFQGTILLDEVSLLPLDLQKALSQWLDWNHNQQRPVRLIAASSDTLDTLASKRQFNPQLCARLQKLTIPTQPLSRRRRDIPALAQAIWANNHAFLPPSLSQDAWHVLEAHHWPGNFTELQRMAHVIALTFGGKKASANQIRRLLAATASRNLPCRVAMKPKNMQTRFNLKAHLAQEEALLLVAALERGGGKIPRAAKLAGIDCTEFCNKLHQYGIALPDLG